MTDPIVDSDVAGPVDTDLDVDDSALGGPPSAKGAGEDENVSDDDLIKATPPASPNSTQQQEGGEAGVSTFGRKTSPGGVANSKSKTPPDPRLSRSPERDREPSEASSAISSASQDYLADLFKMRDGLEKSKIRRSGNSSSRGGPPPGEYFDDFRGESGPGDFYDERDGDDDDDEYGFGFSSAGHGYAASFLAMFFGSRRLRMLIVAGLVLMFVAVVVASSVGGEEKGVQKAGSGGQGVRGGGGGSDLPVVTAEGSQVHVEDAEQKIPPQQQPQSCADDPDHIIDLGNSHNCGDWLSGVGGMVLESRCQLVESTGLRVKDYCRKSCDNCPSVTTAQGGGAGVSQQVAGGSPPASTATASSKPVAPAVETAPAATTAQPPPEQDSQAQTKPSILDSPPPLETTGCADDPTFTFYDHKNQLRNCADWVANVGRPKLHETRCQESAGKRDDNGAEILFRDYCRKSCHLCS